MWFDGSAAVVFALGAVFTAIGTGHKPAQAALLPSLADDPRQLAASNALWSAVDSVGFLAGAVAAGVLIAAGGVELALAATCAAFVLAALALAGIAADPAPKLTYERHRVELAEGFRAVAHEPRLRLVVGVLGASTLIEGAIDVLVVLVALELLSLGPAGVGWLNSAWGLGGVIGGAGAVVILARGRNATGLALAGVLVGVPLIVLGAVPNGCRGRGADGPRRRLRGDGGRGAHARPAARVRRRAGARVRRRRGDVLADDRDRVAARAGAGRHARPARRAAGGRRRAAAGRPGPLAGAGADGGADAGPGARVPAAARGRDARAAAGGAPRGARAPGDARARRRRPADPDARARRATAST